jgi:hypothetical protein
MIYSLLLVAFCLLGAFALPFWVYDVNRWFDQPGSFDFRRAVVGMVVCIVILEYGLWLVRKMWEQELRERAPGEPLPKSNPVVVFRWALLGYSQLTALMMFLTTLDGGLRWAAARWVYLAYAVPALVLAVVPSQRRTWLERLFLRWGWAPVLAFGVPFALPRLLAAGLIVNPWD